MNNLPKITTELKQAHTELILHSDILTYSKQWYNILEVIKMAFKLIFIILLFMTLFDELERIKNYDLPSAQLRLSSGTIYLN